MTPCEVDGCDRPILVEKRGLCGKHYKRWQTHGDPTITKLEWDPATRLQRDLETRPDGCWIYHGSDANQEGHQRWYVGGKRHLVHRWMYEVLVGPIPAGLVLDHLCRTTSCCNPAHLEPVTQRVNLMRGQGATAMNARKTHCKRDHEFTDDNTIRTATGARQCRACRNAAARRYQRAKRAA